MKVQQLETVRDTARRDFIDHRHQFGDGDAELRSVAAGCRPFSRTCHGNPHAHAKLGTNTKLGCKREHESQFGILFEDRNDVLSQKLPDQEQPHHRPIFVSIADEERPIVFDLHAINEQPEMFAETLERSDFVPELDLDDLHLVVTGG